jgi:hypothetical protein
VRTPPQAPPAVINAGRNDERRSRRRWEKIREIRDDILRDFFRGLPKLEEGFLAGTPRVFVMAWAFVAHTE